MERNGRIYRWFESSVNSEGIETSLDAICVRVSLRAV